VSAPGEKRALDDVVREMREATEHPEVDWERVEAKLFARVKAEAEEKKRRAAHPMWLPVAGVLAAAAAAALFVGRPREATLDAPTVQAEPAAGTIVGRDGDGEVLVNGSAAAAGTSVGARAVVETRGGARALIERAGADGAKTVAFWVEPMSRIVVTRTQGTLVLSLERGAVEAKVAPATQGEPFAVDVGTSRVAVHGTELRVAREGARVVIDVNEGVVAIGATPRSGETRGSTVAAPAHAEFAADDVATLKVDHTPSSVRPAVAFAIPVAATAPTVALAPTSSAPAPPPAPTTPPLVATAPKPAPSAQPAVIEPDPHAETSIARGIRACIAARPPAPGVKLTVSTVVDVTIADDGFIQRARFDPPLAPDTQACATSALYRVRFTRGGSVSIPIDYSFAE